MRLENDVVEYIYSQVTTFFPDENYSKGDIKKIIKRVEERLGYCFSRVKSKYFYNNGCVMFNKFNTDQYCMFVYLMSHEAFKVDNVNLAEKLFCLNKLLHGLDLFYSVELPDLFLLVHPVGSVIGHAKFGDGLVIYQNVTIGSDVGGEYPRIGQNCVFFSGATLIGKCNIQDNTTFAMRSSGRNVETCGNTILTGTYPNNRLIENKKNNYDLYFR